MWVVGRSGSCVCTAHSLAWTAPSRRNVGADAVRVLRSSSLQAWRVVTSFSRWARADERGQLEIVSAVGDSGQRGSGLATYPACASRDWNNAISDAQNTSLAQRRAIT